MKEFSGAQDSLYNCFDRTVFNMASSTVASNDRNKNFRYAALNRAAMHTQFGHKLVHINFSLITTFLPLNAVMLMNKKFNYLLLCLFNKDVLYIT